MGKTTYELVQDFSHQQYEPSDSGLTFLSPGWYQQTFQKGHKETHLKKGHQQNCQEHVIAKRYRNISVEIPHGIRFFKGFFPPKKPFSLCWSMVIFGDPWGGMSTFPGCTPDEFGHEPRGG